MENRLLRSKNRNWQAREGTISVATREKMKGGYRGNSENQASSDLGNVLNTELMRIVHRWEVDAGGVRNQGDPQICVQIGLLPGGCARVCVWCTSFSLN